MGGTPPAKPTAHVRLNRRNRLCLRSFLYANIWMHKCVDKTHTKVAVGIPSLVRILWVLTHYSHSHPLFYDMLQLCNTWHKSWRVSSLYFWVQRPAHRDSFAHCSRISNQPCEFVLYVTTAAPTIWIFKVMRTCSIQQVPIHYQWKSGPESIAQTRSFLLNWNPGSPEKQWSSSTHSSAWAEPYLPTVSAEKRGIFQQNKPLSQHAHTDFSFLETLWVTHTEVFRLLAGLITNANPPQKR